MVYSGSTFGLIDVPRWGRMFQEIDDDIETKIPRSTTRDDVLANYVGLYGPGKQNAWLVNAQIGDSAPCECCISWTMPGVTRLISARISTASLRLIGWGRA